MERADIQQAAEIVSKQLNETNRGAIGKISRLIEIMGIDFVQSHVEETHKIEADGGMMLPNNSRKRTTGGVFLYITKAKLTPEQLAYVSPPEDWKKFREAKKRKKQAKKRAEQKESKQKIQKYPDKS